MLALWLTAGILGASADAPPVITTPGPILVGGMRSYAPRSVRKAYKRTEEAIARADDAAKLAEAVKVAAPVFAGTEARSEYDALRLKAERMAREEAALEQWRADIARAAIISELRLLMLSIETAAIEDEDAAIMLLLAA